MVRVTVEIESQKKEMHKHDKCFLPLVYKDVQGPSNTTGVGRKQR